MKPSIPLLHYWLELPKEEFTTEKKTPE